jgi:hypothetical protein
MAYDEIRSGMMNAASKKKEQRICIRRSWFL